MRIRRLGAAALGSVLAAGCSFLIDFDELQRNPSREPGFEAGFGTGGAENDGSLSGGSGGKAGTGGARTDASVPPDATLDAGPPVCDSSCADDDPCTVDTCERSGCTHTYTPGVVADGLSQTFTAAKFHRVTMMANGDRFYVSAFKSTGAAFDVDLYRFTSTDDKVSGPNSLAAVTTGAGAPVSALGMTRGLGGLEIVSYGAFGDDPSKPAKVYRLRFDVGTMKLADISAVATDSNYLGSRTTYPVAWSEGVSDIWGAWPGNGGGIYLDDGKTIIGPSSPPTLATNGQVVALAPIGVGQTPGLLYVTDRPYVRANGQLLAFGAAQCNTTAGTYTTAFSGFTGIDSVWVGGWTKNLPALPVSEQLPLLCIRNGLNGANCVTATDCKQGEQELSAVRNPALTFAHVQGDPETRLYQVFVVPSVDPTKAESLLQVQIIRADFTIAGDAGVDAALVTKTPVTLARGKTDKLLEGPDLPAVAFLGPDKFAVAWIQHAKDAAEDELHVERERICFLPKPTP